MAIYEGDNSTEEEPQAGPSPWLLYLIHGVCIIFIYATFQILALFHFIFAIAFLVSFGLINAYISRVLWKIEINNSISSQLMHSIGLIVFLFIIDIPVRITGGFFIPFSLASNLILALFLLLYIPIVGYVAKLIAGAFEKTTPDNIPISVLSMAEK